jgi:hypothetical protein
MPNSDLVSLLFFFYIFYVLLSVFSSFYLAFMSQFLQACYARSFSVVTAATTMLMVRLIQSKDEPV